MPAVFQCPHCEKSYPLKSSLIGRKVRCSDCRGIFQLQGDGTVHKVDRETTKPGAASEGTRRQVSRQLTGRNKRVDEKSLTERIKKSRSSLRDAANAALSGVQQESVQRTTPADGSGSVAAKPVEIVRRRQQGPSTAPVYFWLGVCGLLFAAIVTAIYLYEVSPQRQALDDFSKTVDKKYAVYPFRMEQYRNRMWVYSRDGYDKPSIILNTNKAVLSERVELPWPRLTEICQNHFGGMSLLPFLAIMVDSEKQALVEEMWEQYPDKFYMEGFFKRLKRQGVRYIHCRKIPEMLRADGVTDRELYIISLLLAGSCDAEGSPCQDFGLVSTIVARSAFICEFNGDRGMKLIERATDYEVLGSADYCGLVLGFTGIPGREDQWRVLDVREGTSMEQFYDKRYNPFLTLNDRVRDYITANYGNVPEEQPEPDSGVDQQ